MCRRSAGMSTAGSKTTSASAPAALFGAGSLALELGKIVAEHEDRHVQSETSGNPFLCAACNQEILDRVYMWEDRMYCSSRCRPSCYTMCICGSDCEEEQGCRAPCSPSSTKSEVYDFDLEEVVEVLDLETGIWVKSLITDLCTRGAYNLKVLDTELAACNGLVGAEGRMIPPERIRQVQSSTACASGVLHFAERTLLDAISRLLTAGFNIDTSVNPSVNRASLYGRVWFGEPKEETRSFARADSTVGSLPEARFTPQKEKFGRVASVACSEATTMASVTFSRGDSDELSLPQSC